MTLTTIRGCDDPRNGLVAAHRRRVVRFPIQKRGVRRRTDEWIVPKVVVQDDLFTRQRSIKYHEVEDVPIQHVPSILDDRITYQEIRNSGFNVRRDLHRVI